MEDDEEEDEEWRKHLNKITHNDKKRKLFAERDKMMIVESGVERMFGEDRVSARYGRLEEEEDLRREEEEKRRKLEKKQRH